MFTNKEQKLARVKKLSTYEYHTLYNKIQQAFEQNEMPSGHEQVEEGMEKFLKMKEKRLREEKRRAKDNR